MSGSTTKLEIELLILTDELTHALLKVIQIENLNGPPKLEIVEYQYDSTEQYEDSIPDDLPHMGPPKHLYTRSTKYSYSQGYEDDRK